MSTPKTCFLFEDFHDELPDPGFYPGSIKTARFRRSANKNRMLEVVTALQGVESAYKLVTDYFVLEGERVSPSGIFLARRRLVELYQACRIFPKKGDQIAPTQLVGARLQVRVEHEQWQGRMQLRVLAYRPLEPFLSNEQIPFRV